ncbi:MAG TPA: GspH/FimT family pseudopilin [Burkholderiaceae bacterium]
MIPFFAANVPAARRRRPRAGFTLVELMVTIAIVAIVAALGVPSFMRVLARHAINSQAEELQDAVRIGRNEAMKRSGPVVLCRTEETNPSHCAGSGGSWQTWVLFTDVNRSGAFAAGDAILRQHMDVSSRMTVRGNASSIRFEATGIAHADTGSSTIVLAERNGGGNPWQRQVCVNPRGEVAVIAGDATCP